MKSMDRNSIRFILLAIICLFSVTNLMAQGPPITTETPIMLGLEGGGIRTFGRFTANDNSETYIHILALPYNFTSKFQVGGVLPFVVKTPYAGEQRSGFGDLTIFAKHQLFKKDLVAKTFRITALLRQTFPTGKSSGTVPIGSGAYQTYLGLILGKISTKAGFYGDIGYGIISDGLPNNLVYNISAGLPLLPQQYPQKQLNAFVEVNGISTLEKKVHRLFFSPGLQFIPGRRILFESSFQWPLLQEKVADKTTYSILVGLRFLIN